MTTLNTVYPKWKRALQEKKIDCDADVFDAYLLSAGYVYGAADEFLSAVAGGDRIAGPITMTGTHADLDQFYADDEITFPAVPPGPDDVAAVLVVWHQASDATSRLVAVMGRDSTSVPIALAPDGGDLFVSWPIGVTKI